MSDTVAAPIPHCAAPAEPADDAPMRLLFCERAKRQRWLDVEAALARAEAEAGVVPWDAAEKIAAAAHLDLLDYGRILEGEAATGHVMVPLIAELARAAGPGHGGWVHWGATTQNIQQTGDTVGIREAHGRLRERITAVIASLADLAARYADTPMAGRTHWQHAVPITFGYKAAVWADVMARHLERMDQLGPRLFVSMTAGAAGTFASLGERGPAVQASVARQLGLAPMTVSSRSLVDHFAEFVSVLAMVCASAASVSEEVARLMSTEFGELSEPVPAGDVGSSTMPQKRNPKLCGQIVTGAAQVRALVPLALEAMIQSHEVDGARSAMMDRAVEQATILADDVLNTLDRVLSGLEVFPERMEANLGLTGGLITAEAVMMRLARSIGRQEAHTVVHHAALQASSGGTTFTEALIEDPQVTARLTDSEITDLLDPAHHLGLCSRIAAETSERVRALINHP
ncbi:MULTISPECIES: adenylosuccinate lyase family protein [Arthrobacter]|uniref:Adenylosuccinate lyase family protein n=1 Tax=Arthrobacter terricola TaxID=2547396 RepID=A0A4R5KYB8_9MICC|nr:MULTISPECIES: adenylosuccinate lyase family protein [Arthrobacter]MBT8160104.1 adenylosuccinate lyase family protein [Arthrobacter sp. GN70]TDG01100.1 adenylosuccinate lyase family protein [Arthrobacter terricola]